MARLLQVPSDVQNQTTGVRAETFGVGVYRTVIDLEGLTLPDIAGGASLAVGRQIFTFPAGGIKVLGSSLVAVTLSETQGNVTADTPDLGIGTVIASGAVAVLGGTATFEDILTGQTINDCNGTAETVSVNTELLIQAGDSHNVFLNVADGWAASGDDGILVGGRVVIVWAQL
jgi:hypothetical protein